MNWHRIGCTLFILRQDAKIVLSCVAVPAGLMLLCGCLAWLCSVWGLIVLILLCLVLFVWACASWAASAWKRASRTPRP